MASIVQQQVHTGNTVRLKIAGKDVGGGQSINMNQDAGVEPVHVIGTPMPQEHVSQRWGAQITLSMFALRRADLADTDAESLGEDVLFRNLIDIEVLDNVTQEPVRTYEGCTLRSSSFTVQANAFAGRNVVFEALNVRAA